MTYHFVPLDHPENEPHRPKYDPLPRYVQEAFAFTDSSLDFVIVDGHYRVACIQASLSKLKVGGILILDNSNWLPSPREWGIPGQFRIVHRSAYLNSETTIFLRTSA